MKDYKEIWNPMSDINLDTHWMPFTAMRAFKANPRMITGAQGHYFTTDDGRQVFDSLSGLWCTGAGHNVEAINAAITAQLSELDFELLLCGEGCELVFVALENVAKEQVLLT